ncbi:MAG: hypothetical protein JRD93_21190 [Deltaproteobacteria bacterium]|nr:hypothetical protein [Deltaproteobacteria bacterium]
MTTYGDRIFEMGGVPVGGNSNSQSHPVFGVEYFVDTLSGSDSNDGLTPSTAKATIQAAVTLQIANDSLLGDVIYIFPGTYAESVVGDLNRVQIIGLDCGGTAHAVSIRPTASYSFNGQMMESALRNLMLMSPSASNKTLPAVLLDYGGYSVIDNCTFIGRDATCITGLQLGPTADNATAGKFDYSAITNCVFSSFYGASSQFAYGIKLGNTAAASTPGARQMWHSVIANNRIAAKTTGIHIGANTGNVDGTVIENNYIHSFESDNGCATAGIAFLAEQHSLIVTRNRIVAADGLVNVGANSAQDNYVAVSGTVATENPATT